MQKSDNIINLNFTQTHSGCYVCLNNPYYHYYINSRTNFDSHKKVNLKATTFHFFWWQEKCIKFLATKRKLCLSLRDSFVAMRRDTRVELREIVRKTLNVPLGSTEETTDNSQSIMIWLCVYGGCTWATSNKVGAVHNNALGCVCC